MNRRTARRTPAYAVLLVGGLLLGLCLPALLGVDTGASTSQGRGSSSEVSASFPSAGNTSGGGDPSGYSASTLCPSPGPTIWGIQWNCVAILNLTMVVLILGSIGIIAYVFRGSDRAELPGEAAEIPVTAGEEEEWRRDRKLGVAYRPAEPAPEEERE
jgi:hypothetical protein